MVETDYESVECERCERDFPEDVVSPVTIEEDHHLCEGCRLSIEDDIENYNWYDRYTEEHHEMAVEILENQKEIECVHDWYNGGEIIVHTKYVSSNVVTDVCEHFGLQIMAFRPIWQEEDTWDCVEEAGSMFQILLEYRHNSPPPLPVEEEFSPLDINYLEDNDKQFE